MYFKNIKFELTADVKQSYQSSYLSLEFKGKMRTSVEKPHNTAQQI